MNITTILTIIGIVGGLVLALLLLKKVLLPSASRKEIKKTIKKTDDLIEKNIELIDKYKK